MNRGITLNERLYIRSRVKKSINEEVKRKIAQRIVENSYKNTKIEEFLAGIPKKDLRGIIETYQQYKELIHIAVQDLNKKVYNGHFTKSRREVNQILKEHKVINKKGVLRESWAEFGLDMLFGFGPAIHLNPFSKYL